MSLGPLAGLEEVGVVMRRIVAVAGSVILFIFALAQREAKGFEGPWPSLDFSGHSVFSEVLQGHYYSIGARKYLNSFTSYQFPNPFPPGQDPLSRLEFPIDQWFAGIQTGYAASYWTVEAQGWINLTRDARSRMQDSDWADDAAPDQKSIFSESRCRMNRGYLLDLRVELAVALTAPIHLRPVLGWRCESFWFTTHDGYQEELDGRSLDLPGDGIDFRQVFYHYYFGGIFRTDLNAGRFSPFLPSVRLDLQLDYGLVTAANEDLHLLRTGDRVTKENTRGHCWHVSANAGFILRNSIKARIEADFKRLLTNGSHRLINYPFEIDFSFDGAHVWSDQASISAVGEFSF